MQILPNIEIIDLALYLDSVLVISDVHIGYEEALNKQGVLVPRMQFDDIVKKMKSIFSKVKGLKTIIVNGDLKHEFGVISEQEWRNTLKFIDLLLSHAGKVVLIKGNHDSILEPIAKKRKIEVAKYYMIEKPKRLLKKSSILIIHGDKTLSQEQLKEVGTIIIGHEHPAVSIKEGPRTEIFKCFLKGKYKGKNLIVQPSLNSLVPGTDILKETILSPFLKQKLDNFDVYAVEDKIYHFGKLKELR